MPEGITDHDGYREVFRKPCAALDYALDIRKFEIGLYWERAKYFWTLLTAVFAGFFLLAAYNKKELLFLVSCIGLVLSTGWYLVNRGSKYWQENWERHVDALEDDVIGPLYKTTIHKRQFNKMKLHAGYPYSVSKINQLISLFVMLVWLVLALWVFPGWNDVAGFINSYVPRLPDAVASRLNWLSYISIDFLLLILTAIFVVLLFWCGVGGSQEKRRRVWKAKEREIDFIISKLASPGRQHGLLKRFMLTGGNVLKTVQGRCKVHWGGQAKAP